jgi:hypothetical protein
MSNKYFFFVNFFDFFDFEVKKPTGCIEGAKPEKRRLLFNRSGRQLFGRGVDTKDRCGIPAYVTTALFASGTAANPGSLPCKIP